MALYEVPCNEPQLVPNKLAKASDDHTADDPYCPNHPLPLLVDRIQRYIEGETEKPLELLVSSQVANSLQVKKALNGRRTVYEDGVLLISPMPTRIHNSCAFWFGQMWEEKIKPLLSKNEAAHVKTGPIETFLRRSRDDQDDVGKRPSITKEPDFACGFCRPSGKTMLSPVPRIVLETGLSETSDELAVDIDEWFKGTKSVQLVFTIKISETNPTDENSPGRTERIHGLMARFGRKTTTSVSSDEGEDITSQSSVDSEKAQDGIAKELVVGDWVGPLSAYCEAWERFGDRYRRRGRRVVSHSTD